MNYSVINFHTNPFSMFKKLMSQSPDLQNEKQKDYRNVVIIQVIIIVFGLTFSGFLMDGSETPGAKLVTTILSCFAALYSFLLWDLLRDFTENKKIINAYLIVLMIVVIGSLNEFPYYKIIEVPNRRMLLLLIHSLLFPLEATVIAFGIRDIFSGEYLTPDKLWGSACLFLMIAISFGSLYDLICIIKPGSLGVPIELGLTNYSECSAYSLCVIGGLDTPYPNASRIIKSISIIEAVWSNLFVILIIGKLMGLPRPPKPDQP